MKIPYSLLIIGTCILLAACASSKKQPATTILPTPPYPLVYKTPTIGIYPPGKAELAAIQNQFSDVTYEQLTEGYTIYTEGACIGCHQAKNIYNYTEVSWKGIIDDMARMANISIEQKNAVYKYVLSTKAVQPPKALPASH
jgi:hypothetical protein